MDSTAIDPMAGATYTPKEPLETPSACLHMSCAGTPLPNPETLRRDPILLLRFGRRSSCLANRRTAGLTLRRSEITAMAISTLRGRR